MSSASSARYSRSHRLFNSGVISAGQRYLPELFRARGYRTAAVIGNELFDPVLGSGFQRSFDEYLCAASPPSSTRARRPPAVEWSGNCWKEPATSASIAEKAIAVLDRVSASPFFLYVHFMDPPQLYDLSADPPLEDPERTAALIAKVKAWRTRHAPPPSSGVDLQPEDRERLRALGYLGEADPGT